MALKPLRDRLVVKQLEAQEQTKGGIVLPDSAKEQPQEATVLTVGTGKLQDDGSITALGVKKGDRVLYGKYTGTEVTVSGEEYLILREEDILAVVQS